MCPPAHQPDSEQLEYWLVPAWSGASDESAVPGQDKTVALEAIMIWFVLILSGVLEAVWATALGMSDGLSKVGPTVVFFVSLSLSMVGLAWAMKSLPTGTSYAIWVGIGATLTVVYGMITGTEPVSAIRIALILGLIGCIVGLKLVS